MVPKRPRREDQLVPRLQPTMSMVPHIHGFDLMPTDEGGQDRGTEETEGGQKKGEGGP